MPNVRFTKKTGYAPTSSFWRWRDINRQLSRQEDGAVAEEFAERVSELRDELDDLLKAGLSLGAEDALATLAEEDMTNFCIIVDLAEAVAIPGVEPLSEEQQRELLVFLDREPWHSLAIDNDIVVALALLDKVGATHTNRSVYEAAPGLLDLLGSVLSRVNREQLLRFTGEYEVLAERDHLQFPAELVEVLNVLVKAATQRLGVPPITLR